MSELLELAERCEQAKGPDRVIDNSIYDIIEFGGDGTDSDFNGPPYTASLDAVMMLIDPSDEWDISTMYSIARATVGLNRDHQTSWPGYGEHAGCNAILALCAAALRARAAQ